MRALSSTQKGALMRCSAEWSFWGIKSRGKRISSICRSRTLDVLVKRGLVEIEYNTMVCGFFWRRTEAAGPQPEDIRVEVFGSVLGHAVDTIPAPHIKSWLDENAPSGWYYRNLRDIKGSTFEIHFADTAEAVLFKLRWM